MANIFSKIFGGGKKKAEASLPSPMSINYNEGSRYARGNVYAVFDGETTIGSMGPAKNYINDFGTLVTRSRQMYLESPICRAVVDRYVEWVVSAGLNLEAEPELRVLSKEGITLDAEKFNDDVEALWAITAKSKMFDSAGQNTMYALTEQAYREGKLAGSMLVVLRVVNGQVKVQHIPESAVCTPDTCNIKNTPTGIEYVYSNGNRVRKGVEIDEDGKYVAFHIAVGTGNEYVRVEAEDKKGFTRAYMYYGRMPAVGETRAEPLSTVVMETAKKLERYTKAALAGAEERAKFALFFEQDKYGEDEDPLAGRRAKALVGMSAPGSFAESDIAIDAKGEVIANDVAVSMERTVQMLPRGMKAKAIGSETEVNIPGFATFHVDTIAAAVSMPPDVLMGKYENSFSSSRMSGKTWERKFLTERDWLGENYLAPIYALQMYLWVLANKVNAPGYLQRLAAKNESALEAYTNCRWTANMFPDIDPLKTVKYVRAMLGPSFDHMPLCTLERGAEILEQGGYLSIVKQTGKELEAGATEGIKPIEKTPASGAPRQGSEGENEPENPTTERTEVKF